MFLLFNILDLFKIIHVVAAEPKTYANLLKSSSNVIPYIINSSSQPVVGSSLASSQPRAPSPPSNQVFSTRIANTVTNNLGNRSNTTGGSGNVRMNQQQSTRLSNRQDSVRSSISGRNSINEDGGWGK